MIESWLLLETHCFWFPARGVDSKVGLVGPWFIGSAFWKNLTLRYDSILERLKSRPSETNAFLSWWGFEQDQDQALDLRRQGSAQAMALMKRKNWVQPQTLEQEPRRTCEIRDASGWLQRIW